MIAIYKSKYNIENCEMNVYYSRDILNVVLQQYFVINIS